MVILFKVDPMFFFSQIQSIQGGQFSNLGEFPILQMLYKQGMIIPNHINNKGLKPILMGTEKEVDISIRVHL